MKNNSFCPKIVIICLFFAMSVFLKAYNFALAKNKEISFPMWRK